MAARGTLDRDHEIPPTVGAPDGFHTRGINPGPTTRASQAVQKTDATETAPGKDANAGGRIHLQQQQGQEDTNRDEKE